MDKLGTASVICVHAIWFINQNSKSNKIELKFNF